MADTKEKIVPQPVVEVKEKPAPSPFGRPNDKVGRVRLNGLLQFPFGTYDLVVTEEMRTKTSSELVAESMVMQPLGVVVALRESDREKRGANHVEGLIIPWGSIQYAIPPK